MRFNKPYCFIKLKMKRVSDVLPSSSRRKKYVVWLDYDYGLNEEILSDIRSCIHILALGSILIVTVDATPRLSEDGEYDELSEEGRRKILLQEIRSNLSSYYPDEINRRVLSRNACPSFLAKVLFTYFHQEVSNRGGLGFMQLINYKYADGAMMLSYGGMIANKKFEEQVNKSKVYDLDFVRNDPEPTTISVPPLTVKEKKCLESRLNRIATVEKLQFELDEEMLTSFKKFYRYYPTYHETLL
jgi:hypothetical protein